jgi:hypothetical protein
VTSGLDYITQGSSTSRAHKATQRASLPAGGTLLSRPPALGAARPCLLLLLVLQSHVGATNRRAYSTLIDVKRRAP